MDTVTINKEEAEMLIFMSDHCPVINVDTMRVMKKLHKIAPDASAWWIIQEMTND